VTGAPDLDADVAVIGAGAVGLAVAAELARTHSVVVIERHESFGRETTSHNSGVIHSGIYYRTGSLKHRAAIEGNPALYAWCERYGVAHRRTGKLIVALPGDKDGELDAILAQARANEVPGIRALTGAQARDLEPLVPATEALLSPTTGIVDQIGYARSLESVAAERGALLAYHHELRGAIHETAGFRLDLLDPHGAATTLRVGALVNSAGHGAPAIAAALGYPLDGAGEIPPLRQHVNRGAYYDVVAPEFAHAVSHLVYPLPRPQLEGLGVHLTIDIDGALHLGPDTTWLEDGAPLDYRNDASGLTEFLQAGRRLLPSLGADDLAPGQVGYRPKRSGPGEPEADFLLWHDLGYVHLGGIESPGLTASLPLASAVARLLR
jgi:L-2-hydroxyglutarate oxidase LhgO